MSLKSTTRTSNTYIHIIRSRLVKELLNYFIVDSRIRRNRQLDFSGTSTYLASEIQTHEVCDLSQLKLLPGILASTKANI